MINMENVTINGRNYRRTYSRDGFLVRKIGTNEIYSEAIDLLTTPYEYEETNQQISEGE